MGPQVKNGPKGQGDVSRWSNLEWPAWDDTQKELEPRIKQEHDKENPKDKQTQRK